MVLLVSVVPAGPGLAAGDGSCPTLVPAGLGCVLVHFSSRGCSGGNHSLEVFGKLGGRGKGGCSSFNNAGKVVAVETSSRSSKCQDQTAPTAAARLSPERLPRAGSLEAGWLFLETLGVSWPSA